jgi:hypothetical protein
MGCLVGETRGRIYWRRLPYSVNAQLYGQEVPRGLLSRRAATLVTAEGWTVMKTVNNVATTAAAAGRVLATAQGSQREAISKQHGRILEVKELLISLLVNANKLTAAIERKIQ